MGVILSTLFLAFLEGFIISRSVYIGLLWYIILLPFNYPVDIFGGVTIWLSEWLVISAFFGVLLTQPCEECSRIFHDRIFPYLGGWFILEIISVLYAPKLSSAVKQCIRWANLPLWYWIITTGRRDMKTMRRFFISFACYGIFLSLVGLLNLYIIKTGPLPKMYRSLFADKNIFASYLSFSAVFLFIYLETTPTHSVWNWLYFIFISFNLAESKARAACIAWGGFIVFILLRKGICMKTFLLGLFFLITVLIIVPLPNIEDFNFSDGSLAVRLAAWKSSLIYWARAPMFGNGAASFEHFSRIYNFGEIGNHYVFNDPFNMFLQVAIETGLFGLTFFLVSIIRGFIPFDFLDKDISIYRLSGFIIAVMFIINALFSIVDYAQFIFLSMALSLLETSGGRGAVCQESLYMI